MNYFWHSLVITISGIAGAAVVTALFAYTAYDGMIDRNRTLFPSRFSATMQVLSLDTEAKLLDGIIRTSSIGTKDEAVRVGLIEGTRIEKRSKIVENDIITKYTPRLPARLEEVSSGGTIFVRLFIQPSGLVVAEYILIEL